MLTTRTRIVFPARAWSVLLFASAGCADHERAPRYESWAATPVASAEAPCKTPSLGCPCENPGSLADCGEVIARTDSYVTCMQGVRVCTDQRIWGECGGEQVIGERRQAEDKQTLAFGAVASCSEQNPCDPLCRQIVDTGVEVTGLPDGLCSTASGISLCRTCGYTGPVADLAYLAMPEPWRRIPDECTPADDRCPLDTVCVNARCQSRVLSCAASPGACGVDLTVAKPCVDSGMQYHVPLCNRGGEALTAGTVRIGVDSRAAAISACALSPEDGLPDFPDRGSIVYTLADGQRIEPGSCVDVNSNNSQAISLDLSGHRAFIANYDAQLAECNFCNNASVFVASSDTPEFSRCTPCVGLECNQVAASTTLRGTVYDPAGTRPIPGVIVYVANSAVAPLVDGVACDACDATVSGSPLVLTTTDDAGRFVLSDMPSDIPFELVIQIGRWRRRVSVAPLPSATTRWLTGLDLTTARFNLTADERESTLVHPDWRLRLPRTQRRCNSQGCAGEGDIPRIALIMADADPLQCTFRRIGIADSEFTQDWNHGRVHLFDAQGMWQFGTRLGYGSESALLRGNGADGQPLLRRYSMLVAPCDVAPELTAYSGVAYHSSADSSGPSYNAGPAPVTTALERQNVKDFVNAGGRLLTTDWMAMDLVHLNYDPPDLARLGATEPVPLASPYDPRVDPDFDAEVSAYGSARPGFGWSYVPESSYDLAAPALFLFGNNVQSSSARAHESGLAPTERYASIGYDIDQASALGASFAAWAATVGATSSSRAARLRWREWSPMVHAVRAGQGAIALLRGDSREPARFEWSDPAATKVPTGAQQPCLQGSGDRYDCTSATWEDEHVAMFQLDAPAGAVEQCGRVGVASGHVSQHTCFAPSFSRGQAYCDPNLATTAGAPAPDCGCFRFPSSADLACGGREPSEEEKAFEFLLFSTSRCVGEVSRPVRAQSLARATFTRDFESNCAADELVVWQLFSWQATVPEGTRIEFFATTANSQAELEHADYVAIGSANQTTTTWTAGEQTVDQSLRLSRATPLVSQRWLRVKGDLVPSGAKSPTLSEWRVVFNCK